MALQRTKDPDDGVVYASPALLIAAQREARLLKQWPGRVLSRLSGSYLSRFKGRGMEFDEARPYQPGDDIRNMDWRVTARTNKPHSKVFREERERPVLLWVDFRSSMFFGSQRCYKSVLAAQVAGLMAWKAIQQGDRLGALMFSEGSHLEHRPEGGKPATLHVIKQLSAFSRGAEKVPEPDDQSAERALTRLRQVTRPGSLVYLISDFRFSFDQLESTLNRLAKHNEPMLIQVSDPLERQLPRAGIYRVSDGAKESEINSAGKRSRLDYENRFERHQQGLRDLAKRTGVHYRHISTEQSALEGLVNEFNRRG